MPRYTASMRQIMPDQREFSAHISRVGNLYRAYLSSLVATLQPKHVVELGTGTGVSAAFMMETLPESSILTTVEIRELDYSSGSPWRFDHLSPWKGDPRLRRIKGDVLDEGIASSVDTIDLLYIDTDHSLAQATREWSIYEPKVASGGMIVVDDIHLNGDMERFWAGIEYPKLDTGQTIHFSGFGVVKKP